jgi:hypothetical protein
MFIAQVARENSKLRRSVMFQGYQEPDPGVPSRAAGWDGTVREGMSPGRPCLTVGLLTRSLDYSLNF